jgi:hypothetical protein
MVSNNGNSFLVLNLVNTTDSTRVNLTDLAADLRFVQLETRPECLISGATYYITARYILARTKTGIFQFDHSGKFIRILVTQGPGPNEFSSADWVFDEKNDQMILADEQKPGYFMRFDLKTGEYLGNIPKAIPGVTRRFALTVYGSLACVPYMNPGEQPGPYYLYWQDLNGKLIDAIKAPSNLTIMRGNYFEPVAEGYRYMLAYLNKDTIYTVRDKKLIPFLAFNHGEEFPEDMEAEGYRNMKIAAETDRYLILGKLQVSRAVSSESGTSLSYTGYDYLIDKIQKKAFLISGIYNDFIGSPQPVQAYKILPNHIIYNALQAFELIGIAERSINNPKSDQKLIGRMTEFRGHISREDNPVLVIGRTK